MKLTVDQLRKIYPTCPVSKLTLYLPFLIKAMEEFEINTLPRVQMFLAQIGHESVELRYFEEMASGSAYEGRRDLGNIFPGDGKRFKGRGPIQITGRSNYELYGKLLGLPLTLYPEKAALPENAFRIAGCFWKRNLLNQLADKGDFYMITRKINGGNNGQKDREKYLALCQKYITSLE